MNLHENQLRLIRHLVRFGRLDYPSCLKILDWGDGKDSTTLSYAFRPLTKYDYLSKDREGVVTVQAKGKRLFPNERPLVTLSGNGADRRRSISVSRTAALLEYHGIPAYSQIVDTQEPYFIPSARWRKISPGILSTTRFVGMLMMDSRRLAVYDIGDGTMGWQLRAELSLFRERYRGTPTKATGMLLICDEVHRVNVATNIIRHTVWDRRRLLQVSYQSDPDRPLSISKAPIRVRAEYNHVYLTTPSRLKDSIFRIRYEDYFISKLRGDHTPLHDPPLGEFEAWPQRWYVNLTTDLLKYTYFFAKVKDQQDINEPYFQKLNYTVSLFEEDVPIMEQFPKIWESKEATWNVCELRKNTSTAKA